MYKGIEWLKEEIGDLPITDTVFISDGLSYIDSAVSVMSVYDLIDQLDEPEALSKEWINNNVVHVRGLGDIFEAETVENLLVPKQELPVIPKYVADFIKVRKHTDAYNLQYIFYIAMYNSGSDQFKEEYYWIRQNDETFARAWLDGYEVEEEPLYYALIKGHEVSNFHDIYWNYDKTDDGVFVSRLHPPHDNFLNEMSKEDWSKLGINDSNADFVKVEG